LLLTPPARSFLRSSSSRARRRSGEWGTHVEHRGDTRDARDRPAAAGSNANRGDRGRLAAAISNAISTLYRDYYGRGPNRTRTLIGDEYVIVFLHDAYTPVERTLIEAGRFDAVHTTRRAFQDIMRQRFSGAVEELVGRKVVAFLSQVHEDPDISVEAFILERDGDPDGDAPAAG
jgi:uncharacterized protein YbcI